MLAHSLKKKNIILWAVNDKFLLLLHYKVETSRRPISFLLLHKAVYYWGKAVKASVLFKEKSGSWEGEKDDSTH